MLGLLDRNRAALGQPGIALILLSRESQRRLRLRNLFVGLLDTRLLRADLRRDVCDVGQRLIDLRLGLVDLRPIVALFEDHQHGAGLDEFVISYRDVDDLCADLRTDRDGAGIDEGIVRRYVAARVYPPDDDPDEHGDANRGDRQHQPAAFAQARQPG